ncbi:MAG: DUF3515 family protein [Microbacteriaceae bacterium]
MRRVLTGAVALALAALALGGCAALGFPGPVALDAAPDAADVACAAVTVALPETLADLADRDTTAQATGAWGDPAAVTLRCGVAVPGPSTLPCYELDGVYWLLDDSDDPVYRYTTFGRDPAVQVVVDQSVVSTYSVLSGLSAALAALPATGDVCTDADDTDADTDTSTGDADAG